MNIQGLITTVADIDPFHGSKSVRPARISYRAAVSGAAGRVTDMGRLFAAAILLVAAFAPPVSAQLEGELLEQFCRKAMRGVQADVPPQDIEGAFALAACTFYVAGIIDYAGMAPGGNRLFCLPPSGISREQVVRIYLRHLDRHPEDLHYTARTILIVAMRTAFPCD